MKILSVTAQKPDSTGSGVYMTELVKSFQKLEVEQAVIAGVTKEDFICMPEYVKTYPVYYETEALPFSVLGMSDEMPYKSTKYSQMTESMTKQLKKAFSDKLDEVANAFHPDIILCHHLYFVTAVVREKFPDLKVYGICHGSDLRQIKKNPWEREYIKRHILKLDGILALHKEQKKQIQKYFQCTEEKVSVLGTGYNQYLFCRMPDIEQNKNKLELLFAGKVSEKKGVKSLIRSLEYLSEKRKVTLWIAGGHGNTKEYQEIKELAKKSSCEVVFLGKLNQQELAVYMNRCSVFVLPSFYEGLPLTIMEAMACGAKVVCTDLPGIQEWLDDFLPEHCCVFVTPPDMVNEDEPKESQLPDFEKRLADAMEKAKLLDSIPVEKIEQVSWAGVARRFLAFDSEHDSVRG